MLLSDLKTGESAIVTALNNTSEIKARLNDLGIVKGVKITLIRIAPFSDPLEIKVRDYYLAIRKSEAEKIVVVKSYV